MSEYHYQFVRRGKKDGLNIVRVYNLLGEYYHVGWVCFVNKGDVEAVKAMGLNLVHQFIAVLMNNNDPQNYNLQNYGGTQRYYYGMRLPIRVIEMPEHLGVQDNLPGGACYWREFIDNRGYDMRPQYYNSQDYE